MIRKAEAAEESLDPGAAARGSSSPLTPSNDTHLQSDPLNITRLQDHDNNTNNYRRPPPPLPLPPIISW